MKKLLDIIKIGLDWIKRFAIPIIVLIIILFLISNGCQKRRAEKLFEKITKLNIENDVLIEKNKEIDKELDYQNSLLMIKDLQIDSVVDLKNKAKTLASYWKNKSNNISEDLLKISGDSSYNFTQIVYDYMGNKKYGYNELQVKGIHKTYLENNNKEKELDFTNLALVECEKGFILAEESNSILKDKFNSKVLQFDNLNKVNLNNEEKIKLLQKEIKRESKWFAGFGVGPNLSVTYMDGKITPTIGIGVQYNIYKW